MEWNAAALILGKGCLCCLPGCLQPLLILLTQMEMSETAIWKRSDGNTTEHQKRGNGTFWRNHTGAETACSAVDSAHKALQAKVGFIRVTPPRVMSKSIFGTINWWHTGSPLKHFCASPSGPKWAEEIWFWSELLTVCIIFTLKTRISHAHLSALGQAGSVGSLGK